MEILEACKDIEWCLLILEKMVLEQKRIEVYGDSQSAVHLVKNLMFHSRTKHISQHYYYVRTKLGRRRGDMFEEDVRFQESCWCAH